MTADLNVFQNAEKSDSANAFGNDNRIKTPANQVCPLITRHSRQARTDANEFSSDDLIVLSLSFQLLIRHRMRFDNDSVALRFVHFINRGNHLRTYLSTIPFV